MEPSTVIIVLLSVALFISICVCRSNRKRINQLERDVTHLMTGTVEKDYSGKR